MALTQSIYDSIEQLNAAFSTRIADLLSRGIANNGRASLVVSGGRTPAKMFNALSHKEIEWHKVDITLADERWVDEEDPASNGAMVKRELLINNAANANFYALKTEHADAGDAVDNCNEMLKRIKTPFDVLILGMGEDGHTASLFPCSAQIKEGLDPEQQSDFIAVTPTTAPNQRMSLTLNRLLKSENVFLHLTGESKKQVLDQALENDDALEMPIRAMLNQTHVELVWAA